MAPIQHPIWYGETRLRSSDRDREPDSQVEVLKHQNEILRQELLRAQDEATNLRHVISDMSKGRELDLDLAVKQIPAAVIGWGGDLSGGLLTVRAGEREGIEKGSIAVVLPVFFRAWTSLSRGVTV